VKQEPSLPAPLHAPAPAAQTVPSPESIQLQTSDCLLHWIAHRQGSPAELLRALEEQVGWPARHVLLAALSALRDRNDLPPADRKYLNSTLNHGAILQALAGEAGPDAEYQSSLDELFARSRRYRRSAKFAGAVEFISKFRDYSPFNNMLVFLQNPLATHFATARHWHKAFGRTLKEEARGLVILAPRTPVLIVYDIADTEGPPLPGQLRVFTQTSGPFNPLLLDRTVKNCERDRILLERKSMGPLRGGFATGRARDASWKMRVALRQELPPAAAYAVLCHELAHIYLGHVGPDKDGWWPCRLNLSQAVTEIEAEAVAHIVCRRAGLRTHSAEYLASFVGEESDLDSVSLDLVSRAAARIEEMGRRLLAPRKEAAGD